MKQTLPLLWFVPAALLALAAFYFMTNYYAVIYDTSSEPVLTNAGLWKLCLLAAIGAAVAGLHTQQLLTKAQLPPKQQDSSAPESQSKVRTPLTRPTVCFKFEPLTDLAADCARKFAAYPLRFVPEVFISPEHYFPPERKFVKDSRDFAETRIVIETKEAFYADSAIFFRDTFTSSATPEQLTQALMACMLDAWVEQNLPTLAPDASNGTRQACRTLLNKALKLGVPDTPPDPPKVF